MIKNKAYYLLLIALVVAFGGLFSCANDDLSQEIKSVPSEGFMKLQLSLPDYQMPDIIDKRTGTRAMDDKAENTIKTDQLQVLVFSEEATDTTYYYKAPVVDGSLQIDPSDPSKATVTIKMVKTDTPETKKVSMIVIANHDLAGVTLTEGVSRKEEVVKNLQYLMPASNGKWNASTGNSTSLPMWGEIKGVKVSEQNMIAPELILYRALARVDVGLAFKTTGGSITEEAEGIAGFKISDVKVYRTFNKGYLAPLSASPKPGEIGYEPSVPGDATRRADNAPVSFGPFTQTNSYVREIYIPEANLPGTPSNDNMHCIVVGGYYDGVRSYYRLDFAEDTDRDTRVYMPILRNHRYIFNIKNVSGVGFETPEDALRSVSSGTIDYELIVWDETIHEMHIQGKHYFGLDNREITLNAKRTAEMPANRFDIKYQTNYPITNTDKITFEWENPANPLDPSVSSLFEAETIAGGAKGIIRIKALTNNESKATLSDVLRVRVGSFLIKVVVNQENMNLKYNLDCSSVKVLGTYRPGYNLSPNTHKIQLTFIAEDPSIIGSAYEIHTEEIYGIKFQASGNVTAMTQTVQLTGTGKLETPIDARTAPFTVNIVSNSGSGSHCEATIYPVISKMRVLSIANDNATYRYDISIPSGGAYSILKSQNNFGSNENSLVKIESLDIIQGRNGGGLQYLKPLSADSYKWLRDGMEVTEDGVTRKYLADILYVGHDGLYNMSTSEVQTLLTYMKNGGVIVMFNEGGDPSGGSQGDGIAGPQRIFKGLFPTANIHLGRAGTNAVIPFAGNAIYKTGTDTEWNEFMYKLQNDPILNGPFGDIRDKHWGEDASWATAINTSAFPRKSGSNEISDDISIYSYVADFSSAHINNSKEYASGFKYETDQNSSNLVSFVFFGDGGFISTNNNSTAIVPCPFWWNPTTLMPVAKPNYNGTGIPVYNSQAFCNIMAWAVQRSADLFHKREAAMGR
ncbi:hypothetical protein [Massilibacteroides vaginae]|uniref:hypothetical protein n=1 Tax=Massilibacteroides vaginae TaxID=1673718 RepID=UPI000A1CE0B9|nr:hypothetical protein [Massilibacteroides vaginae]